MRRTPQAPAEIVQLTLEPQLFKELLRDLLFREAGRWYFKRLAIPRRYRWLSPWRTLPLPQAERQLLPVGGRHTEQRIQEFFTRHTVLRAEFYQGGMPVTAVRVLRQHCLPLNGALERVYSLECRHATATAYQIAVVGGLTPPGFQAPQEEGKDC